MNAMLFRMQHGITATLKRQSVLKTGRQTGRIIIQPLLKITVRQSSFALQSLQAAQRLLVTVQITVLQ